MSACSAGADPSGQVIGTLFESTRQEWQSADVGACGSTLRPPGKGSVAGDAPPDRKGWGSPLLGVSRVSIIDSGKVVSFTTGRDGSEFPLGTVSIQRVGSDEDYALNPGGREFPEFGGDNNAGRHPHATGVSTNKDFSGRL